MKLIVLWNNGNPKAMMQMPMGTLVHHPLYAQIKPMEMAA